MIRQWGGVASWLLDIRSYLFGDVPQRDDEEDDGGGEDDDDVVAGEGGQMLQVAQPLPEIDQGEGLGAAHQALLQREGPTGFQEYTRPKYFAARICALLGLMVVSLLVISLVMMVVPVWFGRQVSHPVPDTRIEVSVLTCRSVRLAIWPVRHLSLIHI